MYSFSPKIEFNILTLNLNLTKGKDLREEILNTNKVLIWAFYVQPRYLTLCF